MDLENNYRYSHHYDQIRNYIHLHIENHEQNESQRCTFGVNAVIKNYRWHKLLSRLGDFTDPSGPSHAIQIQF